MTRACVADASVARSVDFPCGSILKRHLLHSRGCQNWRCSFVFSQLFGDGRHHVAVGRVVTAQEGSIPPRLTTFHSHAVNSLRPRKCSTSDGNRTARAASTPELGRKPAPPRRRVLAPSKAGFLFESTAGVDYSNYNGAQPWVLVKNGSLRLCGILLSRWR